MDIFANMTIIKISNVCRMNLINTKSASMHSRPHHALYLKLEGKTVYESDGIDYPCDPDHVIFLPQGSNYHVRFEKPGIAFRIEFDTIESIYGIRSIHIKNPLDIIHTMIRLENLWLFQKEAYLPRAMSELYGLLAQIHMNICSSYIPADRQKKLEPAMHYLEKNFDNPALRIEHLAQKAGISEAYFRRLFAEVYKISPGQYIRNIRIEKAKALLSGESCSVEEAAVAVGFTNIYHFSRTFRQLTGEKASSYAQKD